MQHFSKWLIASFTPWTVDKHGAIETQFDFSTLELLTLMKAWDNSNASKINKQQFRSMQTILNRKQRSRKYRDALTLQRSRNVDWWHECDNISKNNTFWKSEKTKTKKTNTPMTRIKNPSRSNGSSTTLWNIRCFDG